MNRLLLGGKTQRDDFLLADNGRRFETVF